MDKTFIILTHPSGHLRRKVVQFLFMGHMFSMTK